MLRFSSKATTSYIPLIGNGSNSSSSPGPSQADEMAAANVTGKQWGANLDRQDASSKPGWIQDLSQS